MAIYDLSQSLSKQNAILRFKKLLDAGEVIELKKKDIVRTAKQNNYLHLILSYAAVQLGESLEWTKNRYYKFAANKEIFCTRYEDPHLHVTTTRMRSSASLTTEEMSLSIERFKNWCATVPAEPFVLPDAENPRELAAAAIEVEQNKQYL